MKDEHTRLEGFMREKDDGTIGMYFDAEEVQAMDGDIRILHGRGPEVYYDGKWEAIKTRSNNNPT